MKRTLTIKPSFKAKLDQMAREAEAGATIRFDNEADALAFLTGKHPYDLERAERTTTNDDLTSPFVQSMLEADNSIFGEDDE